MRKTRVTAILTSVYILTSIFILTVYAGFYGHLPVTTRVRAGFKVHFGDDWISTVSTDIHITCWLTDDWINYTLDSFGEQQIYHNATEPATVYIDGVERAEGIGWAYDGVIGIATVDASSTVEISYSGSVPPVTPSYTIVTGGGYPATFYMRSDVWTTYSTTGYKLATQQSTTGTSQLTLNVGTVWSLYGIRAWIVDSAGNTSELTSGTPVAQASALGTGVFSGFWNCSGYDYPVSALLVKVYHQFEGGSWTLSGTWITEALPKLANPTITPNVDTYFKLSAGTWTLNYYANRTVSGGYTYSTLHWGSPAYNTTLHLYYTPSTVYEFQSFSLAQGDAVGFVLAPYSYFIGTNLTFCFIVVIFSISLYVRNPEAGITPIAILLMLFGGAGGILTTMIPALGLPLAWAFFVFGITGLLYKLVKGRGYGEP